MDLTLIPSTRTSLEEAHIKGEYEFDDGSYINNYQDLINGIKKRAEEKELHKALVVIEGPRRGFSNGCPKVKIMKALERAEFFNYLDNLFKSNNLYGKKISLDSTFDACKANLSCYRRCTIDCATDLFKKFESFKLEDLKDFFNEIKDKFFGKLTLIISEPNPSPDREKNSLIFNLYQSKDQDYFGIQD